LADGDEREFGGREEGVDADQRQDREELQGDHCWLILARGVGQWGKGVKGRVISDK